MGKGSVGPIEVIKQFSNAFGAVHFGIDVASYFIGRDKCHAAQKYDGSQSVRSVLPAPPPIFYPRAVLELTVKKAFVKVDFFQTSKKNGIAMRGTKLLHVCMRAGLDSIA